MIPLFYERITLSEDDLLALGEKCILLRQNFIIIGENFGVKNFVQFFFGNIFLLLSRNEIEMKYA